MPPDLEIGNLEKTFEALRLAEGVVKSFSEIIRDAILTFLDESGLNFHVSGQVGQIVLFESSNLKIVRFEKGATVFQVPLHIFSASPEIKSVFTQGIITSQIMGNINSLHTWR